jgi:hypothetical protein
MARFELRDRLLQRSFPFLLIKTRQRDQRTGDSRHEKIVTHLLRSSNGCISFGLQF